MKNKTLQLLFLFLFFAILWLPVIQANLSIFKGGELKGAYTLPTDTSFSWAGWFNGSFAPKRTEYLSKNFGLRADFVRLHNQLKYWLFKSSVNDKIIIGKYDYLYGDNYIDEYYGTNYKGEQEINYKTDLLKQLQDTLQKQGIFLFTVIGPGKASFYPEFIPDKIKLPPPPHTNYSSFIASFKKAGVNFIDMRAWFLAMKDTATYRLYPRCGVHWSAYGDLVAFDSLMKYIEHHTGKDLPDMTNLNLKLSTTPQRRDYDAGDGLNLICPLSHDTLAYPYFEADTAGKDKLALLSVGDSYYFEIYGHFAEYFFSEDDYWYYFTQFWTIHRNPADIQNLKNVLSRYQVVCLFYTDAGLSGFGSGFLEAAKEQYHMPAPTATISGR